MIIALEGIDGAGKATVARLCAELLGRRGISAQIVSFPRYGETKASELIKSALNGGLRIDSPAAVHYLATIFALDRSEFFLREPLAQDPGTVWIFDRYVASNQAFQMARLPAERQAAFSEWLDELEFSRLGHPVPALNVLLDIPVAHAEELIKKKNARSYTTAQFDAFERDRQYQGAVRNAYAELSAAQRRVPWRVVDVTSGGALRTPEDIAQEVAEEIGARIKRTT